MTQDHRARRKERGRKVTRGSALRKRLKAYSAMAAAAAAGGAATQSADASVVIHDIGFTTPGPTSSGWIDVDGGLVSTSAAAVPDHDFLFYARTSGGTGGFGMNLRPYF